MAAKIWSMASGKGGVGKSFLTANLGVTLARSDKRTLLVDLDLNGANLHCALGENHRETSVKDYFLGRKSIKECIVETKQPRLHMIPGLSGYWSPLKPSNQQIQTLFSELRKLLHYDYILLDLGPGSNNFNLEVFQGADERVLILNPEGGSIEKNYRFIENWIFWQLSQNMDMVETQALQACLDGYRSAFTPGQVHLQKYLETADAKYLSKLDQHPVRIIVNQARSEADRTLGYSVQSVSRKFHDLPAICVGTVDFDNGVWQSARTRSSFLLDKPFSLISGQLKAVTKEMTQSNFVSQFFKAVI